MVLCSAHIGQAPDQPHAHRGDCGGRFVVFQVPWTEHTWLVFPGLLLVVLNLYWLMHGLGLVGARFRDIELLISSIVPLLFFISPVIYRADRLPAGMNITPSVT